MELCCIFVFDSSQVLVTANPDQASYLQRLIANHDRVWTPRRCCFLFHEEDFCWQSSQNNLKPQNPKQNPLSPVEEGICHPPKMDLKWPLNWFYNSGQRIGSFLYIPILWDGGVVLWSKHWSPPPEKFALRYVWFGAASRSSTQRSWL